MFAVLSPLTSRLDRNPALPVLKQTHLGKLRTLHRALSVTPFDFSLTCVLLLRCGGWICAIRHSKNIKVYFSIIVALVTFLLILREIIWPKTSIYYGLSTFKTSTSTKYKSIYLLRSFALCVCICFYNSIRKYTQWTDEVTYSYISKTVSTLSFKRSH